MICWKLCIWRETEGKDREESEETVDMCKALEDLYNEGIEIGMERGMTCDMERGMELGVVKGVVETLHDFGIEKDVAIQRVMQKFEMPREQAEKDVESYWR